MSDVLGTGQAQVLAALIRRAGRGPVSMGDLQRDTGLTRTRIRRCVAALAAKDLLARTDHGPQPLVVPLTIEQAAATAKERTTHDSPYRGSVRSGGCGEGRCVRVRGRTRPHLQLPN